MSLNRRAEQSSIKTYKVETQPSKLPNDYHCQCKYCQKYLGLLIGSDGKFYNKFDRNQYYVDKGKHVAKTPLHVARWCIQNFSRPLDWVLDPTIGAGTTAVEALNHNRNVVGVEIEFKNLVIENINNGNNPFSRSFHIFEGDARDITRFCTEVNQKYSLIVNNPPYSGDECEKKTNFTSIGKDGNYLYDRKFDNLAFLKETSVYWETIRSIYHGAIEFLENGGHFCVGVKDMIKDKKPLLLHYMLGEILGQTLKYIGMALLPHYPPTLFMSTYGKRFPNLANVVPRYQTILVFKKG